MKRILFPLFLFCWTLSIAQTDSVFVEENFDYQMEIYPLLDKGILFDLHQNPSGLFISGVHDAETFQFQIKSLNDSILFESFDRDIKWFGTGSNPNDTLARGTYRYYILSDGIQVDGELLLDY